MEKGDRIAHVFEDVDVNGHVKAVIEVNGSEGGLQAGKRLQVVQN